VLLTDAGRDKLVDALDNIGESTGDTQIVTGRKSSRMHTAYHAQPSRSARIH
jgi:hypothetical protein